MLYTKCNFNIKGVRRDITSLLPGAVMKLSGKAGTKRGSCKKINSWVIQLEAVCEVLVELFKDNNLNLLLSLIVWFDGKTQEACIASACKFLKIYEL